MKTKLLLAAALSVASLNAKDGMAFAFIPDTIPFNKSMPKEFAKYYETRKKAPPVDKNTWYWTSMGDESPSELLDFYIDTYNQSNLSKTEISDTPKIPLKIHQIWLGSKLPKKYDALVESWKKFHPTWEYKLWTDEDVKALGNFPNKDLYDKSKNWGEKSDILRYVILERFGGLYVDTDCEAFKPFDVLNHAYTFYTALEPLKPYRVGNAFIAAIPHHSIIRECIDNIKRYSNLRADKFDSVLKLFSVVFVTGPAMLSKSVWTCANQPGFCDIVLPSSYLYPNSAIRVTTRKNGKDKITIKPESFGVHYWDLSWFVVEKKK